MDPKISSKKMQELWHGSLKAYTIGFFTSLILTSFSFILVIIHPFSGQTLFISLSLLALLQAAFQLRYFLHLGKEPRPNWETSIFFFMLLILLIIASGSLWVMHNLNQRTMPHKTEMKHHVA